VRVLLSTYGSRGDVGPPVGLAVRLRAPGAEVRVCAPLDEDFAPRETPGPGVARTGVWILPDERRLPAGLMACRDAGVPPVYVGFGSMPTHASADAAQVAIEAVRAQGRRAVVARGWAADQPYWAGRVAELGIIGADAT
jgi:UDP:flavonoid glycosyltransferase YjiC (YdhE family)